MLGGLTQEQLKETEAPEGSSAMDTDAGEVPMSRTQRLRAEQQVALPWVEKYRPKDTSELVSHAGSKPPDACLWSSTSMP